LKFFFSHRVYFVENRINEKEEVMNDTIIPDELIMNKILMVRGVKVMIDSDLAELYGVATKRLNEQVKPQYPTLSGRLYVPVDGTGEAGGGRKLRPPRTT
jgi:hypothetical protein